MKFSTWNSFSIYKIAFVYPSSFYRVVFGNWSSYTKVKRKFPMNFPEISPKKWKTSMQVAKWQSDEPERVQKMFKDVEHRLHKSSLCVSLNLFFLKYFQAALFFVCFRLFILFMLILREWYKVAWSKYWPNSTFRTVGMDWISVKSPSIFVGCNFLNTKHSIEKLFWQMQNLKDSTDRIIWWFME